MDVVLPRIVLDEVTRNLREEDVKSLYRLLNSAPRVTIVHEPVPVDLVTKYVDLGLREKGDAFLGAFAEWQQVTHLISDNRHFLSELTDAAFKVVNPQQFLQQYLPKA